MDDGNRKSNRLVFSERLLNGWEEIYRGASPPLMALRLVESEIQVLRSMRAQDPELVHGLLDRYERVAARLRGVSSRREAATRMEVSERTLGRWEKMFGDGGLRRLSARLMEREAALLAGIRE